MKYRDSVRRHEKRAGRARQDYMISRYRCAACNCVLRLIPDFLAPYKHYNVDIIMGVIEGKITSDILEYEDYPCENTMLRWLQWFEQNMPFIAEYLLICRAKLIAYGLVILYELASSLEEIRATCARWLSIILRIIYGTGAVLEPIRKTSG